jgi:hypothetical protein
MNKNFLCIFQNSKPAFVTKGAQKKVKAQSWALILTPILCQFDFNWYACILLLTQVALKKLGDNPVSS